MSKVILFYTQPTIENGQYTRGTMWFVTHAPGDGGHDFGYSKNPSDARPMARRLWRLFRDTHGARAQMRNA